jgi:anti-anti-sigma regulatory factor
VAAVAIAVVLVLLMPPLAYLPIPALAAVILLAVVGLTDVRAMRRIWQLKRSEGAIALIAMLGVILYGTLIGVVIAVLLAALNIVRRAAWPQIAEEGRLPDGSYRGLERMAAARRVRGAVILRFQGPLFFATASALQARVRELVADRPEVRAVVLDLGATADVDLTAGEALRQIAVDLARDGRRLAVARPLGAVRDELRSYGLADLMESTSGTRGSVAEALDGLGLEQDDLVEVEVELEPPEPAVGPEPPATVEAVGTAFVVRLVAIGLGIVAAAIAVAFIVSSGGGAPAQGATSVPNLVGLSLDRATVGQRAPASSWRRRFPCVATTSPRKPSSSRIRPPASWRIAVPRSCRT